MATVSTSVVTENGGMFPAYRATVFPMTASVILSSLLNSALKTKSFQLLRDGIPAPETRAISSPRMD